MQTLSISPVTLAFSTAWRSFALRSCPKLKWFTVWLRFAIDGLKLWFTERAWRKEVMAMITRVVVTVVRVMVVKETRAAVINVV